MSASSTRTQCSGVGITIQILLFTVVGGAGSVIGPIIGPLLLVPLAELLRLGLSADYAPISRQFMALAGGGYSAPAVGTRRDPAPMARRPRVVR